MVWFVSPQLWAWKRRRLRWVQERVDKMLVIFPFEETFYRQRGVDAEFVGHPLVGSAAAVCRERLMLRSITRSGEDVDCAAAGEPMEGDSRQSARAA